MGYRLPFHCILALGSSNRIAAASGTQLVVLHANTGEILASNSGAGKPLGEVLAGSIIRIAHLAYDERTQLLAVVTDSKQLLVWDTKTYSLLHQFPLVKRARCLLFAPDASFVIVGDRFGDVYRFDLREGARARLLLGHVSILTSMVLTAVQA